MMGSARNVVRRLGRPKRRVSSRRRRCFARRSSCRSVRAVCSTISVDGLRIAHSSGMMSLQAWSRTKHEPRQPGS